MWRNTVLCSSRFIALAVVGWPLTSAAQGVPQPGPARATTGPVLPASPWPRVEIGGQFGVFFPYGDTTGTAGGRVAISTSRRTAIEFGIERHLDEFRNSRWTDGIDATTDLAYGQLRQTIANVSAGDVFVTLGGGASTHSCGWVPTVSSPMAGR